MAFTFTSHLKNSRYSVKRQIQFAFIANYNFSHARTRFQPPTPLDLSKPVSPPKSALSPRSNTPSPETAPRCPTFASCVRRGSLSAPKTAAPQAASGASCGPTLCLCLSTRQDSELNHSVGRHFNRSASCLANVKLHTQNHLRLY